MNWKDVFRKCMSFEKQVSDLRNPHMINIRIRINGEWKEYDADWIKDMINQEFPEKHVGKF